VERNDAEDARRYRWLRDVANIDYTIAVMDWRTNDWGNNYHIQISGDALDKAIDDAQASIRQPSQSAAENE